MKPYRILIAPDKFKGTLTASAVAEIVAHEFARAMPDAEVLVCPIADGGEGFQAIMADALHLEIRNATVCGPTGEPVESTYAWSQRLAVVELAQASGLSLIPKSSHDPLRATTHGTGELIRHALHQMPEKLIVALGGSATNDGGAGIAVALGYQFLDHNGQPIDPLPLNIEQCERIVPPRKLHLPSIVAACDVTNPLLGSTGASSVYGPQKGADSSTIARLEAALAHLETLVRRDLGISAALRPGAGAAGGAGFGLMCFCGATLEPGFDIIAEALQLEQMIATVDLVVTGEGRYDVQSLSGKGPHMVATLARKHGKRCLAIVGEQCSATSGRSIFDDIYSLVNESTSKSEALNHPHKILAARAQHAALQLQSTRSQMPR